MSDTRVIGVDVGGSGVKAALVDVKRGELASVRPRIDTPQPATPKLVAATVSRLVDQLGGAPSIGITVPAVVRSGASISLARMCASVVFPSPGGPKSST